MLSIFLTKTTRKLLFFIVLLMGFHSMANTVSEKPISVYVTFEKKALVQKDSQDDNNEFVCDMSHPDGKRIIVSVNQDDVTRLSLSEFCFECSTADTIWTTKSSASFDLVSVPMIIKVKARSDSGLFYQSVIKITDSYQFNWIDLLMGIAVIVICIVYFWSRHKLLRSKLSLEDDILDRDNKIMAQQMKYDEMMANYLPKEEFEKLKKQTKEHASRYKMVTVLFAGIHGFSNISQNENAEQLIDDLDRFFFHFDDVVKKLHIEKIKTIGDIYMCAGGIPQKNHTNPIEVVLAAFEMYQYLQNMNLQNNNKYGWNLRIGIHTGPVFCNNAENKKKLEIWGDTVNIASRMEASVQINKVNITGMTYELVKDYFVCQYWGKMPVKYKGEIDMYLIEGFRPHLSVNGLGIKPNQTFRTRLGLVRFDDLEEVVLNMLEEKLPKNLYYHNLKHTIDVTVQVEIIGRHEGINDEELLLLKTAALFHDTGFTRTYKDHEEAGVEIAKEYLPQFDYTQEQIDQICNLIMKTKLPPKPETLLEQIICDADLDYLGRADFIPVSGNLFRELRERGAIADDINQWNKMQIKFIEGHQYFTNSAKQMRDVNKNNQLEAIRRLVEENI